jgi:preprotein translocase subunit SecD
MSSDYISRLRGELLRAGATEPSRVRPARTFRRLRPLALAGTAALLVTALVFTVARPDRGDDRAVPPTATARLSEPVAPGAGELATKTMRERLAAAGISPAFVSSEGDRLEVAVPPDARAAATALMAPGRFAIYDWEAGVLGPDGRPDPRDTAVTGGPDAGRAGALTKAEAQEWADRGENARIVQGESGGWFALAGPVALSNSSLTGARAAVDPMTEDPIVELELTEQGQRDFQELTRTIAQRGADNALGGDPLTTSQHFAIVVDGRIMAVPFINWQEVPDGIDGARGMQIPVGTAEQARQLAAILDSGPMPGS